MAEFGGFYRGRRVLVTGDTGFKGSWLCLWLAALGARVAGFALPPPAGRPSNFSACRIAEHVEHVDGDVRDREALAGAVARHRPEVVFHLAAQPLVHEAHRSPVDTFATNVMGTVHVLEALRRAPSVAAAVIVTSDKCYRNREWAWGYRETDELGGDDPYSASKACAELVVAAYRGSLEDVWRPASVPAIASARAGNVIGGGDWSPARLVPDLVTSVAEGRPAVLRIPAATRPWQHVLEPLSGYLLLGRLLATGDPAYRTAWNFAPMGERPATVLELAGKLLTRMGRPAAGVTLPAEGESARGESTLLRLDADRARQCLGWSAVWDLDATVEATASWYLAHLDGGDADMAPFSAGQIERYAADAAAQGREWAGGGD